jgi:hypothetical protein
MHLSRIGPAAVALVLATPVAAWWLVGDRSPRVPAGAALDYAVRPFELNPAVERTAGILALTVVAVAAVVLVRATRRTLMDPAWWSVLAPLVVAGLVAGAGWRVITAGAVGANIGAGMTAMIGGPVCALLVLQAGLCLLLILVRRHRETRSTGSATATTAG